MTIRQYSDIQYCLGKIEGAMAGANETVSGVVLDALEVLMPLIDKVWEADNGGEEAEE